MGKVRIRILKKPQINPLMLDILSHEAIGNRQLDNIENTDELNEIFNPNSEPTGRRRLRK